jgi:hypothetical protein
MRGGGQSDEGNPEQHGQDVAGGLFHGFLLLFDG